MNKKLLSILLATTILSAGAVMAQTPAPETQDVAETAKVEKRRMPKRFDREHHERMAKKLAKDLNLTPEQQEQADKIRKEGIEKVEPLMEEMKALREKIDAERRANMTEFENILTPEQKTKLKEMQRQGIEKFKRRMNERRGRGMRGMHRPERPVPEHHVDNGMLPPPPPEEEMLPPPPMDEGMLPPPPAEGEMFLPPEVDESVVVEETTVVAD